MESLAASLGIYGSDAYVMKRGTNYSQKENVSDIAGPAGGLVGSDDPATHLFFDLVRAVHYGRHHGRIPLFFLDELDKCDPDCR